MQVCLMIEGQEDVTWNEWSALAQATEAAGLFGLFRSDHYTSFHGDPGGALDAWATLCALAVITDRIRLGTLVSAATFRHPSELARVAVTADHISGGRIEVGVGAGWFEGEHRQNGFVFPAVADRFDLLTEYIEILVHSWGAETFDFEGRHFVLQGQRALPGPVQKPHPPVIVGGAGRPRSLALAARFAQEYNTAFRADREVRPAAGSTRRRLPASGPRPGHAPDVAHDAGRPRRQQRRSRAASLPDAHPLSRSQGARSCRHPR